MNDKVDGFTRPLASMAQPLGNRTPDASELSKRLLRLEAAGLHAVAKAVRNEIKHKERHARS